MLRRLKSFLRGASPEPEEAPRVNTSAPTHISAPGAAPFALTESLMRTSGLPVLDWSAAQEWVDGIAHESARDEAWSACEQAWLEHLREVLGKDYRLRSQGSALLLSTLPDNVAGATLAFVNKTIQRILQLLDGVAAMPGIGQDILIVFNDDEAYYRYVSHYYPEAGEFAASSGMYINHGCGHFVTVKAELHAIEPVIAHELTHSCLSHLPIPAWLNEGLAVNTEQRLCPPPHAGNDPRQLHARHRTFWEPSDIQEFWSGKSFLRSDEANELSYDLARILVSQFAADWDRFRQFVLAAELDDAAASAAYEHLGIDLGAAVCAILERDPAPAWSPQPKAWLDAPERGAF